MSEGNKDTVDMYSARGKMEDYLYILSGEYIASIMAQEDILLAI